MTTITERKIESYQFTATGEKPLPLMKETMEALKVNDPTHPMLKAKGYDLVAIPPRTNTSVFMQEFLETKGEADKVYVAILALGASKNIVNEVEEMTGKCSTNENIPKGARKWETKHVVYESRAVRDDVGMLIYDVNGKMVSRNVEIDAFDTKGDAMSFAKQHAIQNDTTVFVEIEKRLNGSVSRVADISPLKKKVRKVNTITTNQFLFFGKGEVG